MRFKRCQRSEFTDTSRKRSALRRKQRLEREALPLLAEQIAEQQPSEDEVMQERSKRWDDHQRRDRSRRAAQWRRARQEIDAMPEALRKRVKYAWNCAPYPADPDKLLGFLHGMSVGRVDLNDLGFPLSRTDGTGRRINPVFEGHEYEICMTILQARDIAVAPDGFSLDQRKAAYLALQADADTNEDKKRAMADRVLASKLWMRLGELEADVIQLKAA